ncbi:hypothetical protein BKA64DRAFT_769965 [Cadophora sp. MPI-SDFR-AT-0126]|nr:hypothetical protein BKA64DRAFT_769965 [Leotiomycetes sp. MPI-SDFR-AT-0126]
MLEKLDKELEDERLIFEVKENGLNVLEGSDSDDEDEDIDVWDGQLHYLIELGVKPEAMVPLCFEKLMWTVVAPAIRRQKVFDGVKANTCLASPQHIGLMAGTGTVAVPAGRGALQMLAAANGQTLPTVSRTSAAYAICVMVEYGAASTSCLANVKRMGYQTDSRTTLIHGACVCVPSESQAIRDMDLNFAILTISVARSLKPENVQVSIFVGEAIMSDCATSGSIIRLMNGYGPTECCISCASRWLGGWVVDPDDFNRLAPFSTLGELLIEGPLLARSYLKDVPATTAAFIQDPPWLLAGAPGRFQFHSREDTQVKVRGQRAELTEVGCHVRDCIPSIAGVVAEVISRSGSNSMLGAFLQRKDAKETAIVERSVMARMIPVPTELEMQLQTHLTSYMVPSVNFTVARLPMTHSGKTHRKALHESFAGMSAQKLAEGQCGDKSTTID